MRTATLKKVRNIDPLLVVLTGVTVAARLLAWAEGLHVDLAAVGVTANQHTWQLLDLSLLRHDLISATGSLIMQPPLYNLAVGLLLHLPPGSEAPVAGLFLFLCSLATSLATYSTMKVLGIRREVAFVVCVVFVVADPTSLLFSSYLFYAAPTAALVTLTAWAAVRLFERPSGGRAALFAATAATLGLTNTSYQPLMILVLFGAVLGGLRSRARSVALGLAVPAIVLVAWTSAMWVETGAPTTSTWLGMNLAHVTIDASPKPLVRRLVADGTLTRTALVPAFSSLQAYGIAPHTTGPAAQAQITRSDGQPNFNNPAYETASSRSLHNDLAFIAAEPGRYLTTVAMGLRIWAVPGDQYYFFADRHQLTGYATAWDHLVDLQEVRDPYLPLAILAHQSTPLNQISWTEVALGFLSILVAPLVGLAALRRRPRRGWALLVIWAVLAQAFLISSLTEYAENNRFRFETGTLRITLSVVVIAAIVDRLGPGWSRQSSRLGALGWNDATDATPVDTN